VGTGVAHGASDVSVVPVPHLDPAAYAARGAIGLYVPGSGTRASRAAAIASLERGKIENSVLGGMPSGRPLISLAQRPGRITIFVALPPPGTHPNTKRYPLAIVGGGYRGLLTSSSTRIPGLVSLADIAPTAVALDEGRKPVIRSRRDANAPATLERLDDRMTDAHAVRLAATLILVGSVLGGALLATLSGSEYVGRAGLLAAPAALGSSVLLSAAGATRPAVVGSLLAVLTVGASLLLALSPHLLRPSLVGLIAGYLVVLVAWPDVSALAAIGPHPDGGGRFYGSTNLTSGVLLPVALVAGSLAGRRGVVVVALLALLTVGWSRAGADGGGLVMMAAAFLVLALALRRERLTVRNVLLGIGALAAGALLLVGLDAATGGSSHVTRAVRKGPTSLAGDLGHRLQISWATITSNWHAGLVFAVAVGALAVLATRPPQTAPTKALLVGVAVSLLVNDTPTDVASAGALSYAVIWAWERARRLPRPESAGVTVRAHAGGISSRT
jgi:hypothetical protein